jgi:hypothetical protein
MFNAAVDQNNPSKLQVGMTGGLLTYKANADINIGEGEILRVFIDD